MTHDGDKVRYALPLVTHPLSFWAPLIGEPARDRLMVSLDDVNDLLDRLEPGLVPGVDFHREGFCRFGDRATGPWELAPGASEVQQCDTCGRQVGK